MEQRYLSVEEAATYLGVSASALRKWRRTGQIPVCQINGSIRFDRVALDKRMTGS